MRGRSASLLFVLGFGTAVFGLAAAPAPRPPLGPQEAQIQARIRVCVDEAVATMEREGTIIFPTRTVPLPGEQQARRDANLAILRSEPLPQPLSQTEATRQTILIPDMALSRIASIRHDQIARFLPPDTRWTCRYGSGEIGANSSLWRSMRPVVIAYGGLPSNTAKAVTTAAASAQKTTEQGTTSKSATPTAPVAEERPRVVQISAMPRVLSDGDSQKLSEPIAQALDRQTAVIAQQMSLASPTRAETMFIIIFALAVLAAIGFGVFFATAWSYRGQPLRVVIQKEDLI